MSNFNDLKERIIISLILTLGLGLSLIHPVFTIATTLGLTAWMVFEVLSNHIEYERDRATNIRTSLFVIVLIAGGITITTINFQEKRILQLLLIATIVVATDVGAFFGGRLLGGPKPFPKISPNKTASGFACGYICGYLVALATIYFTEDIGNSWETLLFALCIPFAAICGDLLESSVKRKLGIKDFATLLGPIGGFADRFDAMFTAFAIYGLYQLVITKPF